MFEWLILFFALIFIYFIMRTPKKTTDKNISKEKTEQPDVTPAKEVMPKKPSPKKQPVKATQAVSSQATTATPEIAMPERVGLTAGSVWHYLTEHGPSSVAKLIRELPEEEKIIQRSIGWLAQEGKITLDVIDRVETVTLK
jgi:hypothetical protein